MKTLYEELLEQGLSVKGLTLELAWTICYHYRIDQLIGLDIVTHRTVAFNLN